MCGLVTSLANCFPLCTHTMKRGWKTRKMIIMLFPCSFLSLFLSLFPGGSVAEWSSKITLRMKKRVSCNTVPSGAFIVARLICLPAFGVKFGLDFFFIFEKYRYYLVNQ